jgi:hypothetical protein
MPTSGFMAGMTFQGNYRRNLWQNEVDSQPENAL